jgi:hypothetical protein
VPCVCQICGTRFDRPPLIQYGELAALTCEDCGGFLCPHCRSHAVWFVQEGIVLVSPQYAAIVRAAQVSGNA